MLRGWREAVVDGGLLGREAEVIRRFCVQGQALPAVVGSPTPDGWLVSPSDIVEPLEGTLVRLLGRPEEVEAWRRAQDRETWLMRWLTLDGWLPDLTTIVV